MSDASFESAPDDSPSDNSDNAMAKQIETTRAAPRMKLTQLTRSYAKAFLLASKSCGQTARMRDCPGMVEGKTFPRRGIVEGFFGPLWTMAHRRRLFEFGAARGMNTYRFAPVLSCERMHEEKPQ